jgi:hypothetical protein
MIPELEAVEFVNDMSQTTGVLVSFGVNAYYVNPEPKSAFVFLIDPSYLDGAAESSLKHTLIGRDSGSMRSGMTGVGSSSSPRGEA